MGGGGSGDMHLRLEGLRVTPQRNGNKGGGGGVQITCLSDFMNNILPNISFGKDYEATRLIPDKMSLPSMYNGNVDSTSLFLFGYEKNYLTQTIA